MSETEIVPFQAKHLNEAAALVTARYRDLRRELPLAPPRYADLDVIGPLLKSITETAPAVVALRHGKLVGFLAAWMIPSWRGHPLAYSPEWANAAELTDARHIYQALYTRLAAFWVSQRYFVHNLTIFANDRAGIEGWQWLGFGYFVIDGLRPLSPAPNAPEIDVRRAGIADLAVVADLDDQLWAHLTASPIFLSGDNRQDHTAELEAELNDAQKAFFVAWRNEKPVAFLRLEGNNEGACTIVRDPGTASITGAYTVPAARRDGIATSLLNRGLQWAQESGYVRCSVDFEAMNVPAARFWLRHFEPVCISLHRHVNEKMDN